MTVNEEDIEPNFEHPHVCYYFLFGIIIEISCTQDFL